MRTLSTCTAKTNTYDIVLGYFWSRTIHYNINISHKYFFSKQRDNVPTGAERGKNSHKQNKRSLRTETDWGLI